MVRSSFFVSTLLMMTLAVQAQVNRYMVFFRDKNGTSYSVAQPQQFLSQKAIDRRLRQNISVTLDDLPVNPSYVEGVRNAGVQVFYTTRWRNGVLVQGDMSKLSTIQSLPYVDHVEFVAPQAKLHGGRRRISLRKKNTASTGIETETQLQMLGIPEMHRDGLHGEGMTIAILDGGFPGANTIAPFQHIFSGKHFNDSVSFDFVYNTKNVFQYDPHGTEVFSTIAATIPDVFTGGAYEADFQLYVTEDNSSEYRIEEYNWLFAAERADSAGADIISSSLGYYDFDLSNMNYTKEQMDGKTAVVSRAAQAAADRGMLVVVSAGNEGNIPSWRIISAPADAEGVIAVANVNAQGNRSSSSSIGPAADGRIKPDLAALGTGVKLVAPSGGITSASGTSLAAPLITSLAAGVWQQFPDLTSKQLIEALKKTASQAKNPDNNLGYGIPNYTAVIHYLSHQDQTSLFDVYPNPVVDTVTVRPIDPDSVSSCTIELISPLGQVIGMSFVSFTWLNDAFTTDVSYLSPGVYYLRVHTDNKQMTFRIVKR